MSDVLFPNRAITQTLERLRETEALSRKRQSEIADARAGLAHPMFEPLIQMILEFQAELAADQEVGLCLTNFGRDVTISVEEVGCRYPHLMFFRGTHNGEEVQLVQHVSQLNLLLVKLKVEGRPPRRVGFLNEDVEETPVTNE
jgi:hypothetical protein